MYRKISEKTKLIICEYCEGRKALYFVNDNGVRDNIECKACGGTGMLRKTTIITAEDKI